MMKKLKLLKQKNIKYYIQALRDIKELKNILQQCDYNKNKFLKYQESNRKIDLIRIEEGYIDFNYSVLCVTLKINNNNTLILVNNFEIWKNKSSQLLETNVTEQEINQLLNYYIKVTYNQDIKAHEQSTSTNNLCGCDFESHGLCLIGQWLNSCISSVDFLEEKEIV